MKTEDICTQGIWPSVVAILPSDLEQTAQRTGALERCRKVPNAAALMRLIFAYALSDLSIKDVAAWAAGLGILAMSGPAFFYRFRRSEQWLQTVLGQMLSDEVSVHVQGLRLRIVDATVITGPAAGGTDWRVHAVIHPETGVFQSVELTDVKGGESYSRHKIQPGQIVLGDRAYCKAPGIASVVNQGGHVIARLSPHTIPVCNLKKQKINLLSYEDKILKMGARGLNVLIPVPPDKTTKSHKTWDLAKAKAWIPAPVVGARTIKGTVIWVLTTLTPEQISDAMVLDLYRLRWQVELLFKRLKSLLHIDALPTRDGPTAKSWILARLLAAVVAQKMVQPSAPFSPRGYRLGKSPLYTQPLVKISYDPLGSQGGRALYRSLACHQ
jgi:hypothetical protein